MSENRNSRIKKALKEGKVSQEKLGAALGITSQAVNERLNKDQDIDSIEFVETVSRLTGFTVNWILKGMGNMMLSDPIKFIQEEPIHIPEVNEPELAITRKIKDFLSGKTNLSNQRRNRC